ncbi:hypothetical protein GEV33_013424 [Tenebrio molitor]|uniref:Uncharacterized protein n=1 Tax=Tenebrio molitor TaxID=7067 RepID=A0A8J6L7D5_TENMO|nr:hypothetical protein GEV33_013424 [Tenebrio molitor]
MNEFVRRPSRRRDNRVYVPAADIIKRTIRRSWTISNPTPRWTALRGSPELRPYNSLPRGQDINNYPSLALHKANSEPQERSNERNVSPSRLHPACRRTHSEDVYNERPNSPLKSSTNADPTDNVTKRPARVNPLMRLGENKQSSQKSSKSSPRRKSQQTKNEMPENTDKDGKSEGEDVNKNVAKKCDKANTVEKRVSFDSNVANNSNEESKGQRRVSLSPKSKREDNAEEVSTPEVHFAKEETTPVELCDIEPLSGTVFRKVTVRRRRQDMRKIPAVDTGWRRGPETELFDILLPEGDDYKLVFISSDSSSKEEDVDDNDSSSTASSFPIDECDWDYFEPGSGARPVLNWSSPFGSPRVYRRVIESPLGSPLVYRRSRESDTGTDEDNTRLDSPASSDGFTRSRDDEILELRNERVMDEVALQCVHQPDGVDAPQRQPCQSCGAPTQFIPIPVPVPIPFPVPWTPQEAVVLYGPDQNVSPRLRVLPRNLLAYMSQAALIWPLINAGESGSLHSVLRGGECGPESDASMPTVSERSDPATQPTTAEEDPPGAAAGGEDKIEQVNCAEVCEGEVSGYVEAETRCASSSASSCESSDSDDGDDDDDNRKPRVHRVYTVNGGDSRESDDALPSSNVTSDCDEDDGRHSHSSVREDDMSSSGSADTDSDDTGTVADQKPKRFSRTFVVNKNLSSSSNESSSSSDTDTSDNDTDTEMDCTVILTNIKHLSEDVVYEGNGQATVEDPEIEKKSEEITDKNSSIGDNDNVSNCDNLKINNEERSKPPDEFTSEVSQSLQKVIAMKIKESDYVSSSPGLSDVSAESLNSSDVEQVRSYTDDGAEDVAEAAKSDPVEVKSEVSPGNDHTVSIAGEWKSSAGIRSGEPVNVVGEPLNTRGDGERAGALVTGEPDVCISRHAARYTSLVMITQEPAPSYQQVSVVTSDTTTLVADNDVIVRHTNWQEKDHDFSDGRPADNQSQRGESVTVITGGETLSAFEEGLADDDSWVENLSHDEDDDFDSNSPTDDSTSGEEVTLTCSAAIDQEDELRGYHRSAIDFTLHTIVEESCEESEVEQSLTNKDQKPTLATDLEKYFFFRLGDGTTQSITSTREDVCSETSSICSEGLDSLGGPEEPQQQNDGSDLAELASSRLEKYFLHGFMGFTAERRDSDGSVGSDSEGRPSPEQRRKRLVRARGTGRSHSSSLDNLLANPDLSGNDQSTEVQNSENSSSSDSDTYDESNNFEKSDGQFDTVKRKKGKKQKSSNSIDESRGLETTQEVNELENGSDEDEEGHKTPQPEILSLPSNLTTNKNQQSRDSGFIGSCDDLLKEQRENSTPELPNNSKHELKLELENITEEKKIDGKFTPLSTPPATSLTRKDSFNNWSSDEETNLMMCKMRQFFKTMVANSQCNSSSKPTTPTLNSRASPKPVPSPRVKNRCKPPQLVYFENELTRLMKTVPGIRDDQVREIVEYLSSEDTWSDSYDSSDYTSSDLEGTTTKSALQQQISDSCKQIINKFDNGVDDEGDEGDGGIVDESHGLNRETAFVYQKLVASIEKMATGDSSDNKVSYTPHNSPPLIAKVMHHIGSRLVALMHEVSSGESHASNSPKTRHYHRRLQQKLSSASTTTTEDDDSTSDSNLPDTLGNLEDTLPPYNLLPRSRSHDLLVGESRTHHQSSSGVSDIAEEREISDCERFSWRGSFESALLATDSRNKLSLLGGEGSASASALAIAAKRRSAGDLFSQKSLSREQLDRVRSCGSIGGANSEDKLWVASATRPTRRRSSVPDATCGSGGSADGEEDDEDEDIESRSTLPRSLQSGAPTTNSLPRLPTNTPSTSMQKAQSMYHFLPPNAKSARYRPPGFSRLITTVPKRAVSAPGLQPTHQRRGRRSQQHNVPSAVISHLTLAIVVDFESLAAAEGLVTAPAEIEKQMSPDIRRRYVIGIRQAEFSGFANMFKYLFEG